MTKMRYIEKIKVYLFIADRVSVKYLFLFLATTGCVSAGLVRSTYEPEKGGIVKYDNRLLYSSKSEAKAHELMGQFCSPSSYKVTQQDSAIQTVAYNTSYNYNSSYTTPVNASVIYLSFRCEN